MSNSIMNKIFSSNSTLAPLVLRIPVGITFMLHGSQKLFGWFGGYGLEATGQWMASIGLEPGYLMALLAGGVEFFGGIVLIIGLLTRPAAFGLAMTMLVAIVTTHLANGFFMSNNGYEFALALLAASTSLIFSGAGKASIDQLINQRAN
ncbi:DoxX family protein [Vibrio sp. SS-MA-C1-2]|uniref:DoxX family protein n=1 Tax=Vibrio sp. SS-MA-C1-2 TaxID=2908646 RepID=UPI001F316CB4|nr:DoxX family protein [Vibrio sp. SS-MA-C1-2]UJF20033.1 DoxX family protein [Vibrio sp. SS-MA-C1-2]